MYVEEIMRLSVCIGACFKNWKDFDEISCEY
jgi:hypothetical protein